MVTIVKHEWHQHDRQYAIDLDEDLLREIYPDHDDDEIASLLEQLENGEADIDAIFSDAWDNDIDVEWDFQYDDCWTDRKGGYEVTYEYGDEDSWVEPDKEPEPTHKCTKCRWTGQSYNTLTQHLREDGTVIEDYYSSEEESDITKDVCPMCDSDVELTEVGVKEEVERKEREERWARERLEREEAVPCFSCGELHKESELPELSSQYHCPSCGEGWVMMDMRDDEDDEEYDEERTKELEAALEELKREFDELLETEESEEETNEVPAQWPFERPYEGPKQTMEQIAQEEEEVLPNYPAGEYTIRVWGRTREIGVGTITKEQYDYWSDEDHEDDLSDAMNENFDYDEAETPEEARFDMPYYEYQDVESLWGFDEDDTVMTITNSDGEEIYRGDVESFIIEAHGENDSRWDATEEVKEMYPQYLGKGTFVVWTQGGKGSCVQTTIVIEEGQEFDPRKFGYKTYDVDGSSIINTLVYDGVELDDEGMDSEHDNWRGQWSEFNVYENE
jgi:predicted RNA-binding Zn-ribbon protein involved in translation (DUF1610 family)